MIDTPVLQLLKQYLEVTNYRHGVIVSNVANVDTPGYHTRDVDFRTELKRVAGDDSGMFTPVARAVPGLMERPDGNNVNLDREGMLLAESQIQFKLGIQLIRKEFSRLLMAINEGR